jgi:murein L,D-transpeptidase YafK
MRRCYFIALIAAPIFFAALVSCQVAKSSHQYSEIPVQTSSSRSPYYLSLGVSYPNVEDADRGLRDGLISRAQHDAIVRAIKKKAAPPQYTRLGGLIYIHGNGAQSDWTLGCVALENEDIKELFNAVAVGTPVTILP